MGSSMQAKDVMTRNVVTVPPEASIAAVAEVLSRSEISAAPVVDASGALIGIVSEGDLVHRLAAQAPRQRSWWLGLLRDEEAQAKEFVRAHGASAGQVMTRDVVTVSPDAPISEVAALLEQHRVKRVPVVSGGRMVGIVSRANLLHALAAEQGSVGATDAAIRNRILDLIDKAGVTAHRLNVIVSGARVQVWGTVSSPVQLEAVRVAVDSEADGRRIEDYVSVLPSELERQGWA